MKFSEPLLVKPSRNLTMLLAGKSREKCADQNSSLHKVTCSINTDVKNPVESPSPLTNRMVVSALGDAFTSPTRASSSSSSFSSVYKHTNHFGSTTSNRTGYQDINNNKRLETTAFIFE